MNTASFPPVPTQHKSVHLSDDMLDEVLLDIAGPEALAHLRACPACARLVAEFRAPVAAFNTATLAWSESRSQTLHRDVHRPARRMTLAHMHLAGATAILALSFGLHTALHRDAAGAAEADSISVASPGEVASDNAMLAAIDSEITSPQPTRFGLMQSTTSRVTAFPHRVRQTRD